MKIGIIDSGLPKDFKWLKINAVRILITKEYKYIYDYEGIHDDNGHSTVIFEILNRYIDNEDEIFSIKILDKNLKGHSLCLIEGIRLAIQENCKIINISLGTLSLEYLKELQKIIYEAEEEGIIIVAANSNNNKISFPANFNNVYGVFKTDSKEYFCKNSNNFFIKNIQNLNGEVLEGTSYITPHIVGLIKNSLIKTYKINEIQILKKFRKERK